MQCLNVQHRGSVLFLFLALCKRTCLVLLQGVLPLLLTLLTQHGSSNQPLATAALELLALASKAPKAAAQLAGQPLLMPAISASLTAHESSPAVCSAALRCVRRLAKQPGSRAVLLECGAATLQLSTARRMAVLPGQRQQVKVRICAMLACEAC
jgi:hypothetical protein